MTSEARQPPLAGLRVMDISIMAAGPYAGALLGMLGAEVIKVEPPAGDGTRWTMPTQRGMGTNFISMNVNKRDIELDLKSDRGLADARALAGSCDIFLQNFRVGVVERLGLGYDVLSKLNPRLIFASISGFGAEGPLARAGCGDPIMQAFSGFAALNGAPGDAAESFRFTGFLDLATGSQMVAAILGALNRRATTGRGEELQLSMLEAALEMQATRIAEYLATGLEPGAMGSETPAFAPDRAYRAEDREIFVSVLRPSEWGALCAVIERPELESDPRFADNRRRCANRTALDGALAPVFAARPAIWWLRALGRARVPCEIQRGYEAFRYHRQVVENDMIAELETQDWGAVSVGGLPWKFAKTPCEVRPPSAPGADTAAVLDHLRRHGKIKEGAA